MVNEAIKKITNYDNKKLKDWYEKYGFKVTEILEFPGTGKVGQMEYKIK